MKIKYPGFARAVGFTMFCQTAVFGVSVAADTTAQDDDESALLDEIIVTARRQEESAQDIPISMTIVGEDALTNNNVFNPTDLKQLTPSLAVNTRFGPDQASFAIRGFTQELRTAASVGFYFADVVAPRGGAGVTNAGDGAGPGAFFDLQNVLVLKGPQGTLFGRNTTGGAVLVTPKEPTSELEGYLEGSAGNYDMRRLQGVINVPLNDQVRTRFGVDSMEREGYLDNKSGVGPDHFADVDYYSLRASVIVDISHDLENYTIATYGRSKNNGVVMSLLDCGTSPTALFNKGCPEQLQHQGDDIYAVESKTPDPVSELKQWQVINTTTWTFNDDITIKNILSYANLEQKSRSAVFGLNYAYGELGHYQFSGSDQIPGTPTNSQISYVEELQFQGYAFDGDLTWQAGLYFEKSEPDGKSGNTLESRVFCSNLDHANPELSECVDVVRNDFLQRFSGVDVIGGQFPDGYGGLSRYVSEAEFTNEAIYTEMTYDLSDDWKVTGGLRYTHDEIVTDTSAQFWGDFPFAPPTGMPLDTLVTPGNPGITKCVYSTASLNDGCYDHLTNTSEAFTGLLDFDYVLTEDVMLYAKYSRGYRMGSINPFGGELQRVYDPEHVNAYELGAKTKFGGAVPGIFNVALFYNDLQDQQIQYGYLSAGQASTLILNAGSSMIRGLDAEALLNLTNDLRLNLSYTYLDTELKEVDEPVQPAGTRIVKTAEKGEVLTFSPKHSVTANLNYLLPVPAEMGVMSVGMTYSFTDKQNSTSASSTPYAEMDAYEIFNFDANWIGIMGSNFDASLFVTNAFDEEYTTYVSGFYNQLGMETRQVGVPRMWGSRVRYTFD